MAAGKKRKKERNLIIVCPLPSKKAASASIFGFAFLISQLPSNLITKIIDLTS